MFLRGGLVFSGPCLGLWVVMWMWRRGFDPGLLWACRKEALACRVWGLLLISLGVGFKGQKWVTFAGGRKERNIQECLERERLVWGSALFLFKKKSCHSSKLDKLKYFSQTSPFFLYPALFCLEILWTFNENVYNRNKNMCWMWTCVTFMQVPDDFEFCRA